MDQIGLPFHWGRNGYSRGDAANDLTSIVLDPTAHIEEVKALTADIHPGRRPRGDALRGYVETSGTGLGSPRRPEQRNEPYPRR